MSNKKSLLTDCPEDRFKRLMDQLADSVFEIPDRDFSLTEAHKIKAVLLEAAAQTTTGVVRPEVLPPMTLMTRLTKKASGRHAVVIRRVTKQLSERETLVRITKMFSKVGSLMTLPLPSELGGEPGLPIETVPVVRKPRESVS